MKARSEAVKKTAEAANDSETTFIGDAEEKAGKRVAAREKEERRMNGDVGPNVFPDRDQGEAVTVTIGQTTFSPKQFNTFVVGPYASTTAVRPGETRNDAARRVRAQLAVLEQEEFERKLEMFRKCYGKMFERGDA